MKSAPTVLRMWQQEILENLLAQNARQILFCVDLEGGIGKSMLAKYLMNNYDAWISNGGKLNDLTHSCTRSYSIAIYRFTRNNCRSWEEPDQRIRSSLTNLVDDDFELSEEILSQFDESF